MRASANCTSEAKRRWSALRSDRIRDPSFRPPRYEQQSGKLPGSKKLVHGEWVEVKAGDEDAAETKSPGPSSGG